MIINRMNKSIASVDEFNKNGFMKNQFEVSQGYIYLESIYIETIMYIFDV